jgi:hypothetical protein
MTKRNRLPKRAQAKKPARRPKGISRAQLAKVAGGAPPGGAPAGRAQPSGNSNIAKRAWKGLGNVFGRETSTGGHGAIRDTLSRLTPARRNPHVQVMSTPRPSPGGSSAAVGGGRSPQNVAVSPYRGSPTASSNTRIGSPPHVISSSSPNLPGSHLNVPSQVFGSQPTLGARSAASSSPSRGPAGGSAQQLPGPSSAPQISRSALNFGDSFHASQVFGNGGGAPSSPSSGSPARSGNGRPGRR